MCLTEFDVEDAIRTWREDGYTDGLQDGKAQGVAEGIAEGELKKAIDAALKLLKMKLGTPEQIAEAQGLPLEKVLELKQQVENSGTI